MYRRKDANDQSEYPPGSHWGSKNYFIPGDRVPVHSVSNGNVWVSADSPRGWNVVIDHGTHATYYQHMHNPPLLLKGKAVRAGDIIGYVFYNASDDSEQLAHLHFEVWHGGSAGHVNPQPFLDGWVKR